MGRKSITKENMNMKQNLKQAFWLAVMFSPLNVWASATGGSGLPWENPLKLVAASLTGPVILAISIIAMMSAGGTLVFGGELNEFARRSSVAVLATAFLVAGASFMNVLFGVSGAPI
jgi:type IV secretion system protein VirB2